MLEKPVLHRGPYFSAKGHVALCSVLKSEENDELHRTFGNCGAPLNLRLEYAFSRKSTYTCLESAPNLRLKPKMNLPSFRTPRTDKSQLRLAASSTSCFLLLPIITQYHYHYHSKVIATRQDCEISRLGPSYKFDDNQKRTMRQYLRTLHNKKDIKYY